MPSHLQTVCPTVGNALQVSIDHALSDGPIGFGVGIVTPHQSNGGQPAPGVLGYDIRVVDERSKYPSAGARPWVSNGNIELDEMNFLRHAGRLMLDHPINVSIPGWRTS